MTNRFAAFFLTAALAVPVSATVFAQDKAGPQDSAKIDAEIRLRLDDEVGAVIREKTLPGLTKLKKTLQEAEQTTKSPGVNEIVASAKAGLESMHQLKAALENIAGVIDSNIEKLSPTTLDSFLITVLAYYSATGPLHLACESPFADQVGISDAEVGDLDLVIPKAVAARLVKKVSSDPQRAPNLEAFNIGYRLTDEAGGAKKRLSLKANELHYFSTAAFLSFPSEDKLKSLVDTASFKILFAEHAALNSYLYTDERETVKLSPRSDTGLSALQSQADQIVTEALYRKALTKTDLKPVGQALADRRQQLEASQGSFAKTASIFFQLVVAAFQKNIVAERYSKFGSPEELTAVYLKYESEHRVDTVANALKSSPALLGDLSRTDLKEALESAISTSQWGILLSFVSATLFDPVKELPEAQQDLFYGYASMLTKVAAPTDAVNDETLATLGGLRSQLDISVSNLRYNLASIAVSGAEQALAFDERIKALIKPEALENKKDSWDFKYPEDFRFERVPLELIPERHPDLGAVLTALTPDGQPGEGEPESKLFEDIPVWFMEALQTTASKGQTSKGGPQYSQEEMYLLRDALVEGPKSLLDMSSKVERLVTGGSLENGNDGIAPFLPSSIFGMIELPFGMGHISSNPVLDDLRSTNLRLTNSDAHYPWMGGEARLKALQKELTLEGSKRVIEEFLMMGWIADVFKATSLQGLISGAFHDVLESKVDGIEALQESAKKAVAFTKDWRLFSDTRDFLDKLTLGIDRKDRFLHVDALFSKDEDRDVYLRSLLTRPQIYLRYLSFYRGDLKRNIPILWLPIHLPTKIAKSMSISKAITLAELIGWIKDHVHGLGPKADEDFLYKVLSQADMGHVGENDALRAPVNGDLTVFEVLRGALGGHGLTDSEPLEKIAGRLGYGLTCWYKSRSVSQIWLTLAAPVLPMPGGVYPVSSSGGVADRGNGMECASFDDAGLSKDEYWPKVFLARDAIPARADKSSPDVKLLRVIVSSLLGPYLRTTAAGNKSATELVQDPSKDHTRALVQSQAYSELMNELGPAGGGGAEEYKKKVFAWRTNVQTWKMRASKAQEFSQKLFYTSITVPNLPQAAHFAGTSIMAAAALGDYISDMGLYFDSWDNYNALQPYSQSGALGQGLVSRDTADGSRQEMVARFNGLLERSPSDFVFLSPFFMDIPNMGRGFFQSINKIMYMHDLEHLYDELEVRDFERYRADTMHLKEAFDRLGLPLGSETIPYVDEIYEERKKAGASAEELSNWVEAMQAKRAFARKYPKLMAQLAEAGKGGFLSALKTRVARAAIDQPDLVTFPIEMMSGYAEQEQHIHGVLAITDRAQFNWDAAQLKRIFAEAGVQLDSYHLDPSNYRSAEKLFEQAKKKGLSADEALAWDRALFAKKTFAERYPDLVKVFNRPVEKNTPADWVWSRKVAAQVFDSVDPGKTEPPEHVRQAYKDLGLQPGSSLQAVDDQLRRLREEFHPSVFGAKFLQKNGRAPTPEEIAGNDAYFNKLVRARATLSTLFILGSGTDGTVAGTAAGSGSPTGRGKQGARPGATVPSVVADAYKVFGLAPGSSQADVKARYGKLMLETHPDTYRARYMEQNKRPPTDAEMAATTKRFSEVSAAWKALSRYFRGESTLEPSTGKPDDGESPSATGAKRKSQGPRTSEVKITPEILEAFRVLGIVRLPDTTIATMRAVVEDLYFDLKKKLDRPEMISAKIRAMRKGKRTEAQIGAEIQAKLKAVERQSDEYYKAYDVLKKAFDQAEPPAKPKGAAAEDESK